MSKLYIKNRYGQAPNKLLNDEKISAKAKGLFTFLQSKPDGWKFSTRRITSQQKEGKDAISSGLNELEKAGYLRRKSTKDGKGKWSGYDYFLADYPFTDNPLTDKPLTDKGVTLSNKEYSNKEYSNKEGYKQNEVLQINGKEINELIEMFKEVNPSYDRLFSNKTQRACLERLLKKMGREQLEKIIKSLPAIFGKQYAPRITTPFALEQKLADLIAYLQQRSEETNKVFTIK